MDRRAQAEDLEEVRNRFTSWRNNRKRRSAIPENLWDLAVRLCTKYPISRISTTLGLEYPKLKRKVEQARGFSSENIEEKSPFVEVKVSNYGAQRVSEERNEYTVEFFRTDGSRMRIFTRDCVLLNHLSVLFLQSK